MGNIFALLIVSGLSWFGFDFVAVVYNGLVVTEYPIYGWQLRSVLFLAIIGTVAVVGWLSAVLMFFKGLLHEASDIHD